MFYGKKKKSTTICEPLVPNMHLLVLRKITLKRASTTLKGKQLIIETESLKSQDPDRKIQSAFTGYINQKFPPDIQRRTTKRK